MTFEHFGETLATRLPQGRDDHATFFRPLPDDVLGQRVEQLEANVRPLELEVTGPLAVRVHNPGMGVEIFGGNGKNLDGGSPRRHGLPVIHADVEPFRGTAR